MHDKKFGIGQPVRRKEDLRLLTGKGRYTTDVELAEQLRAVVLRSPHAHANIKSIDAAAALAMPGVVAVLTGADVTADNLKPTPTDNATFGPRQAQMAFPDVVLWNRDGSDMHPSPLLPLAVGKVRYVGEGVALIVAETLAIAKDAADLVEVDYDTLPAATHPEDAAKPDAPQLWAEPTNVCLDAEIGDAPATEAVFAKAAHTVRFKTWIQRVTGVTMEPRSATAFYDTSNDHIILHVAAGSGSVRMRAGVIAMIGIAPERLRVICNDVGGNFGTRNALYPETALITWASMRLKRSIKWVSERTESFAADFQGRDLAADIELAIDVKGKFLAMRGSYLGNVGAYNLSIVPLRKAVGILTSVYDVPTAYVTARSVRSNTPTTVPYRSAGRPEAMFIMERLIDLACKTAGLHMPAALESNSVAMLVQFLTVNHGISFLPRLSVWDKLKSGELIAVPVRDRLMNSATIDAITHASRQLPVAAEEFLRFLQGEFQDVHELANASPKREAAAAGSARSLRAAGHASTGDKRS